MLTVDQLDAPRSLLASLLKSVNAEVDPFKYLRLRALKGNEYMEEGRRGL